MIMKKVFTLILSFCLLLGCILPVSAAWNAKEKFSAMTADFVPELKHDAYSVVEEIITGTLSLIQRAIPDRLNAQEISRHQSENFYPGTRDLLKEPAKRSFWSLGYASASLVPSDWREHTYYLGGFIGIENRFTNKLEEVIDDMRVRAIALSDGSGRGVSLFATVDAIGVSNKDIRAIREIVAQEAEKQGIELNAVNVCSTHCHSCIDTQGLWTNLFQKGFKNLFAALTGLYEMESGTDDAYMAFLRTTVADAMIHALGNMTPGKLSYAVKDIGKEYFSNKNRRSANALPSELHRFLFTPEDPAVRSTVIANFGAHPDVAGLPTKTNSGRALSGDFVYYIGDELDKHGFNFMFFNGAIAGIYTGREPSSDGLDLTYRYQISERYGREIAKILMAMTLTREQIEESDLYDAETIEKERAASSGGYTLWCENWIPSQERELRPLLNIRLKEVTITVTNPLILLAGKLKLANYDIFKDNKGKYKIVTEIGYLCLDDVPAVLVPGELVTDLYAGGKSLTKFGSVNRRDFRYEPLKKLFGESTLCFGLANDAIGYIVPDNDYMFVIFDDHYQESISLGAGTASAIMAGFSALADEIA